MPYIDHYLNITAAEGGSDLHIAEGQPPKMRRHGDMVPIGDKVVSHDQVVEMLSGICGQERWKIFRDCGDLDFAYETTEGTRFRCNFLKNANGYGAVFRLIPTKITSLDQLGIPQVAREFGHLRGGLVLVTGPTGSGKSTTLAALIDHVNEGLSRH